MGGIGNKLLLSYGYQKSWLWKVRTGMHRAKLISGGSNRSRSESDGCHLMQNSEVVPYWPPGLNLVGWIQRYASAKKLHHQRSKDPYLWYLFFISFSRRYPCSSRGILSQEYLFSPASKLACGLTVAPGIQTGLARSLGPLRQPDLDRVNLPCPLAYCPCIAQWTAPLLPF